MNSLISSVLLVLGASLLQASDLENFRLSFNEIGLDIDEQVKVLRAENGAAILEMNRKMLRLLGNHTNEVRYVVYSTNTSIQLAEWLNEDPYVQKMCIDAAYVAVDLFSDIAASDIRTCARYAEQETSSDAQYHFYSHAHYIMRAGTEGFGRVLESFGLHSAVDDQLEFLGNEEKWLKFLWTNYKTVLREEIEGHDVAAEQIAEVLDMCLQRAFSWIDRMMQNINYDLNSCVSVTDVKF